MPMKATTTIAEDTGTTTSNSAPRSLPRGRLHVVRRGMLESGLQAAIGWATLSAILVSSLAYGANAPAFWIPLAGSLTLLFAMQLALSTWRGVPAAITRLRIPALLFLAALVWGLIQSLLPVPERWAHPVWEMVPSATPRISADPVASIQIVFRLAAYAMAFVIAVNAAINPARALGFFKAIALYSAALATFGLALALTGNAFGGPGGSHVSASFINRNAYATYALIGTVVNLAVFLRMSRPRGRRTRDRRRRLRNALEAFFGGSWLFAFGVFICLAALLLTGSRAGVAAGLAAIAILPLVYRRGLRGGTLGWLGLMGLLGVSVAAIGSTVVDRALGTASDLRFVIYPHVITGLMERPFLGHGLGAFEDTFRAHVPLEAAAAEWEKAHSSYLENAYEFGIPAALAFYAALVAVGMGLVRGVVVRSRDRVFSATALVCLIGTGLHATLDFALQMPATAALLAFVLGIGWAQAFPRPGSDGADHDDES